MSGGEVSLGKVIDLNPTFKSGLLSPDDLVDFLPMAAVDEGSSIAKAKESRELKKVQKGYTSFSDGDVLLAKITPCFENGKIAQVHLKNQWGFGSTEFHVLRPHADKLDGRYLVHFLRRDQVRIDGERKMTGSAGQRRVPKHFLETLSIRLPPLPEQHRVAAILDQADALRAKRREALAQLDSLTQSIFIEMFGDPIRNQKGWKIAPLSSSVERIQIGPFGTQLHEEDYIDGGIPLVNPTHIKDGKIRPDMSLTISKEKFNQLSQYHLAEGDLVLGRRGEMGRCAVVTTQERGWLCGTGSLFIRPKTNIITPIYLGFVISSISMRRYLDNVSQGVTMANLNKDIVGALPIPIPPIERQRQFILQLASVDAIQNNQRFSQAELDTLFASLQHRAFRGEL